MATRGTEAIHSRREAPHLPSPGPGFPRLPRASRRATPERARSKTSLTGTSSTGSTSSTATSSSTGASSSTVASSSSGSAGTGGTGGQGTGGSGAGTGGASPPGWTLVWSDEFDGPDGSAVDPTKWVYGGPEDGQYNQELGVLQPEHRQRFRGGRQPPPRRQGPARGRRGLVLLERSLPVHLGEDRRRRRPGCPASSRRNSAASRPG